MGGFNLQDLMSQAKRQYETLQKKMEETVVEGSSGGGTVTVKMDGRKQVLSIKIDPEAVKVRRPGDAAGFDYGSNQRRRPQGGRSHAIHHGRNAGRNGHSGTVKLSNWVIEQLSN